MPLLWQEAWGNLVFQDVKNSESIRKERHHGREDIGVQRRPVMLAEDEILWPASSETGSLRPGR
jgi:hypothetical protein